MLEACKSHLWCSDGDISFGAYLLALLAKSASLLRHDWLSALEFSQFLIRHLDLFLGSGDSGHSHTFRLHDAGLKSRVIHLLV